MLLDIAATGRQGFRIASQSTLRKLNLGILGRANGEDLLALLVFIARVANPIAPFLATVLVPSPWRTLRSSCFSATRCCTLAMKACQSDPSAAHVAKTRYTVV